VSLSGGSAVTLYTVTWVVTVINASVGWVAELTGALAFRSEFKTRAYKLSGSRFVRVIYHSAFGTAAGCGSKDREVWFRGSGTHSACSSVGTGRCFPGA
jgi:hypothetical protein